MYILGLNAYHGDAAACLLRDGEVVAAIEEERLTRIKHQAGFPAQAIAACLEMGGIGIEAVEHIAINRDPRGALWRKLLYTLTRRPSPRLVLERLRNARSWAGAEQALAAAFPAARRLGRFHHVDHHLAHLASAFDPSPFERALVVSVDGFGDFASCAWGIASGRELNLLGKIYFPHSLGIFYQALTQYLGFHHFGDEYKVMGLAAYAEPTLATTLERLVEIRRDGTFRLDLRYFRHHRENVAYRWDEGPPRVGRLYSPALERLLGPARAPDAPIEDRHKALAASAQAIYERALFALITRLSERFGERDLALAGGCAQNSSANGKITAETPIRRLYVPSAAADAGGATGAALSVWRNLGGGRQTTPLDHAYLGPAADTGAIEVAVAARMERIAAEKCTLSRGDRAPVAAVAELLAEGKVVGWYQGRMEWGPRALGARSILADPRRDGMRGLLNAKIKLREPFRPFAPSVLAEAIPEWFDLSCPEDAETPFMARVYPLRTERRAQVPAITHVDGTGRVQSVGRDAHPDFRALIEAFHAATGVPMVLNTSFNENEPIVNTPAEALDCFLRTRMDALALGPFLIQR
ncbi:carbamoyltransferase family protein [Endothiovibrio diazotrophicus]